MIAGFYPSEPDDAIDLVRVNKKVLAKRLVGMQAELSEKLSGALGAMAARFRAQSRYRPQVGQGRAPSSSKSLLAILSWSAAEACDGSTPTSSGQ